MAKEKQDPQAEETGLEPVGVSDRELLLRLTGAFEKLVERTSGPATQPENDRFNALIETLSGAMARVADSSLAGAKLIAEESRQAHRPSNQVVPNRSVFNQRGENCPGWVKPRLKCTMMVPWLLENESCTREEVELANLLEPGTYLVRRNDGTKIPLTVSVTYKADMVTPSTLVVNHETAFNNDHFKLMPPLSDLFRMMLKLHPADIAKQARNVLTEDEETAMIEAEQLTVSV